MNFDFYAKMIKLSRKKQKTSFHYIFKYTIRIKVESEKIFIKTKNIGT
jgi:hypothetical protein